MTMLWPAALGLFALAIPIIALYLVKSRVPKRTVSTLLFWEQIKPRLSQQPFWRKLRRWLSLALQLLLLALLVSALTQPQPFWRSSQPERVVYVISGSASMRARDVSPDRWAQAVAMLEQRINQMRYTDEAAVILATDPPQILSGWTTSQRSLKHALSGAAPGAGPADVRPALSLAENLASSREGGRVVFISDGVLSYPLEPGAQTASATAAPAPSAPAQSIVAATPAPTSTAATNSPAPAPAASASPATASASASPAAAPPSAATNAPSASPVATSDPLPAPAPSASTAASEAPAKKPSLTLVRVGSDDAANVGITLFSARRSAVAPGEFQISARIESNLKEPATVEFQLTRDSRVMDVQTVKLEPGKPWEKAWREQGPAAVQFHATISGAARDDLAADNSASARVEGLHKLSVLLVSPQNAFLEALLTSLDLVDWHRVEPGKDTAAETSAAGLVIYSQCLPSAEAKPRAAVFIAPDGTGFWGKSGAPLEAPMVSEWQRESVPLRYVSLDQVRLNSAKTYTPAPGSAVLAESFGHPLIFGDWDPASAPRWLVLGFDLEQSDFVLRTAFPVLLGNVIQSLRPTEQAASAAVLPGPVCSRLTSTVPAEAFVNGPGGGSASPTGATSLGTAASESGAWTTSFMPAHPAWWWLTILGLLLLMIEWRLYSRRVTE
ncbi:hypothetical protein DB346_05630 [Verrucomicrobia bacterium LW23]|nr:hypothetical protein DB346_05630 [Verrucomicrobia bacterium LW23]